jgi:transcriptional regulator with XRE-family HTH domain
MSQEETTSPGVGALLRRWRNLRQLSQLALALDAGVSARHLSFIETGRSRPSAEMVLLLAEQLEVPLRERNRMLLAAGHAPTYPELSIDEPPMAPVKEALDVILEGHEPNPAVVVDRHWNLVAANRTMAALAEGVDESLLEPPVNVMRLGLHPGGLAASIVNMAQLRHYFLGRLERQVAISGDPELTVLLQEVSGYPAPQAGRTPLPRRRPGPCSRRCANAPPRRRRAILLLLHRNLRYGSGGDRLRALDRAGLSRGPGNGRGTAQPTSEVIDTLPRCCHRLRHGAVRRGGGGGALRGFPLGHDARAPRPARLPPR